MSRLALAALATIALALAACDSYGSDEPDATNTFAPTAESTPSESGVREFGEAPVFWRTVDEFKSLQANKPYFVVIRVTGYDQQTLRVRAERVDGSGDPVAFDIVGATPVGEDAEGAFFPTSIELPTAGEWTLYVETGAEDVPLNVTVQPAAAG
jgi:hypothetical protein